VRAVLGGHTKVVLRLAVTGDGKLLATASYDQTVELWDLATGKERAAFEGHGDAAFTPDGKTLRDRRLRRPADALGPDDAQRDRGHRVRIPRGTTRLHARRQDADHCRRGARQTLRRGDWQGADDPEALCPCQGAGHYTGPTGAEWKDTLLVCVFGAWVPVYTFSHKMA
jgi:hypothetical protein